MVKEFRLPELGENITSGDIVQVNVAPGDKIAAEQTLLEIETDKATIEVPAPFDGVIKDILVKAGDVVEVGQLIVTIDTAASEGNGELAAEPAQAAPEEAAPVTRETAEAETPAPTPPLPAPEQAQKPKVETAAQRVEEFRLPELGENITSGDIVNVHVAPGDRVEKDQIVLEIETDKATIEVPSPAQGTIKDVLVKPGQTAEVGQLILTLETTAPAVEKPVAAQPALTEQSEPGAVEPAEAPSPPAPALEPLLPAGPPMEIPASPKTEVPPVKKRLVPASPAVRRFAREIGIDIARVPGTGPGGRISIEDVKRYSRDLRRGEKPAHEGGFMAPGQPQPLPDFSKWGEVSIEPMSNVRKSTARHMAAAWVSIAHVTNHDRADITELEKLRKKFSEKAAAAGGKLTVTAILLKILAAALKVFPKFNCSIDVAKNEIIYKNYYHIGVAVDTERGLLVPVIRDVDKKNIIELSVELNQAAERARARKLSLEEMQGSTFTITNLGGIGGTAFTPIVHWPDVAILGVSRGSYEPVYKDGEFVPRLMLPLSLSYDHRIIDGADAARFLRWVVDALEQPFMIALEG